MAQIVAVVQTSHTPFCYRRPEAWNAARAGTGMPALSGRQGGTLEIRTWIAAAGAVECRTATIVDRVPVYASPIDTAFAYFNL